MPWIFLTEHLWNFPRDSVQSFSIFPFQQNEDDWMWLAAFFIHAPVITIFPESCLVLLNHPHRPARNNSLEPRRKPSKTFSRTSWYVWYECNLKQQIECNSCSLLQFLRFFTFPHTHTHTFYPGPACHEGVCTSSLLVSVDAPGCQPSAACSKKSQHGLKRKHYFMEKQKMMKKYVSSADLGTTHLAIRNENTTKKLTWPMDVLDALGSESQCNQSSFLPVPNCSQVSLDGLDGGRC